MKRIFISIITFFIIGTCTFAGELNIGVTGNNRGLLTPCGCRVPSGGLARISTTIETINEPKLMIGAGNHFFHHTPMPKEDQIFEQKKAAFQAKILSELNYEVINIGQFDLCYGLKVLKSMQEVYSLPFISANILDMDGNRAFPPFKIIEQDDIRIMFLGICHLSDGHNFKIADPMKTLIQLHEDKVFEKADLVVLLADAPAKLLSEFVKEFDGIDIMIASKEHTLTGLPIHYKETALIQMGSQGKHFGIIDLHFENSESTWQDISPLRFKQRSHHLALNEDPEKKKTYQKQIKKVNKQLKRFKKDNQNYFGLEMILLDDSVKDDPKIRKRVKESIGVRSSEL